MHRIKQMFAALFAITAVMLMQSVAFAAYTGSGTKNDPYVVSGYWDFKECIEEKGGYIKLSGDILMTQYGHQFNVSKPTVLDLNSYTVSDYNREPTYVSPRVLFNVHSGFTINATNGGSIIFDDNSKPGENYMFRVYGRLTINGGIFENKNGDLTCPETGSITINGGTIKSLVKNEGYIIINGGTLQGGVYKDLDYSGGHDGMLYITGGEIYGLQIFGRDAYINNCTIHNFFKYYQQSRSCNRNNFFKNCTVTNGAYTYDSDTIDDFFNDNKLSNSEVWPLYRNDGIGDFIVYISNFTADSLVVRPKINYITSISANGNLRPIINSAPVYPTVDSDLPYTVSSDWYLEGTDTKVSKFTAGNTYILKTTFTIKDTSKYVFGGNIPPAFNNTDITEYSVAGVTYTPETVTASYRFTPKLIIDTQPNDYNTPYTYDALVFEVRASNAESYKWHIVDSNGTEYSPADIKNNGWGFVSDNTENKSVLYIGDAMPQLNDKKVYCVVTGNGESITTRQASIKVGYTIIWTDFTMEGLDYVRQGEKIGNYMTAEAPEGKVYNVYTTAWLKYGADSYCASDDVFEAGETYRLFIFPGLEDINFNLAKTLIGTVNGESFYANYDSYLRRSYIFKDITIPADQSGYVIGTEYLSRYIDVPLVGAAPAVKLGYKDSRSTYINKVNNRYTVSDISWSPNDSTFKVNKSYTVTVTLKAQDGYFFSPFEEITLNNNPVKIKSLSNENGGIAVFSYTFTAKGDVDLNGVVNAADAAYILKYASGTITLTTKQLEAADVYEDGKVDTLDAINLLKKI